MNKRRLQPELMDQPGLDPREHAQALEGLRRINRLSRTGTILWSAIAQRAEAGSGRPLRVLDIASGGGDVPISLMGRALAAGFEMEIEGCDVSAEAVRIAQRHADDLRVPVRFSVLDALRDPIPDGFDVITCTLFLHHLKEDDAILLLRKMMQAARQQVLVDDLIRSRLGRLLATIGCHVLSSSRIVHFDGPASVGGAFTPDEALKLAERAGLVGAKLTRHWPQRFLLRWDRS